MSEMQIRIELLSDLCVSDGGVYNSMLDTDICYDELGIPYIPAKRLRGCLRECAHELQEWGKRGISGKRLFGDKWDNISEIRIGNAYIDQYEIWRAWILEHQKNTIVHPQNVLNHFSYIRTQTRINDDTGAADEGTLRTIRVANKGLVFYADVELNPEREKDLETCCMILSHMGVSRTRGMGEVSVRLEPKRKDAASDENEDSGKENMKSGQPMEENVVDCLQYSIELLEPMICKSVDGGEARTLDYIEGSKILGVILQGMKECGKEEQIVEFLNQGELICSNAYLSLDGVRYTEIPATIYEIKNMPDRCVDKIYEPGREHLPEELKEKQLNQMKHCYAAIGSDGNIRKISVRVEERYHHRRPEDKSIGRALATEDDANFYQMASIMQGQTFMGFIQGTEEQLAQVYDILKKKSNVYMGYSRSSEYGAVRLAVKYLEPEGKKQQKVTGKEIVVKLQAPAIVYNKRAFYSTEPKDLLEEVCAALKINEKNDRKDVIDSEVAYYINYTTVGGYNVTWKARKPTISAFNQGTVLYIPLKKEHSIPTGCIFIGERVQEGYGEAEISVVDSNDQGKYQHTVESVSPELKGSKEITFEKLSDMERRMAKALCDERFQEFIRYKAVGVTKEKELQGVNKPTVNNMLLMCSDQSGFDAIKQNVYTRFDKAVEEKQKKLEMAKTILEKAEEGAKGLSACFAKEYGLNGYCYDEDAVKMEFLKNLLKHLKYQIRHKEMNQAKGEKTDGQV